MASQKTVKIISLVALVSSYFFLSISAIADGNIDCGNTFRAFTNYVSSTFAARKKITDMPFVKTASQNEGVVTIVEVNGIAKIEIANATAFKNNLLEVMRTNLGHVQQDSRDLYASWLEGILARGESPPFPLVSDLQSMATPFTLADYNEFLIMVFNGAINNGRANIQAASTGGSRIQRIFTMAKNVARGAGRTVGLATALAVVTSAIAPVTEIINNTVQNVSAPVQSWIWEFRQKIDETYAKISGKKGSDKEDDEIVSITEETIKLKTKYQTTLEKMKTQGKPLTYDEWDNKFNDLKALFARLNILTSKFLPDSPSSGRSTYASLVSSPISTTTNLYQVQTNTAQNISNLHKEQENLKLAQEQRNALLKMQDSAERTEQLADLDKKIAAYQTQINSLEKLVKVGGVVLAQNLAGILVNKFLFPELYGKNAANAEEIGINFAKIYDTILDAAGFEELVNAQQEIIIKMLTDIDQRFTKLHHLKKPIKE